MMARANCQIRTLCKTAGKTTPDSGRIHRSATFTLGLPYQHSRNI